MAHMRTYLRGPSPPPTFTSLLGSFDTISAPIMIPVRMPDMWAISGQREYATVFERLACFRLRLKS